MSRFLKKRHYKLVLPGVEYVDSTTPQFNLEEAIQAYLNLTGVAFTQQDVAEIQTMFLAKYGQSGHTPNAHNLHGEIL